MKCIGLLALMVHAGLHIPASDESVVPIFSDIFVDIGDDQSIESDLSTFSSHLSQLKTIAGHADRRSLVLIDEIGSGTDPTEGGAIAAAFIETMTRLGSFTVATTHHGALKVFAHETPGVTNGAMEFDRATLTPTYRFRAGVPGSSYAMEMAERLGFSSGMLSRARALAGEQQTRLESLIAELEGSAQRNRKDAEELSQQRSRADELVKRYEARLASLTAEVKEMKRKALDEAAQILEGANATIERSVQGIREHGADKPSIRAAREAVAEFKEKIVTQQVEYAQAPTVEPAELAVGSRVTMAGRPDVGEVVSLTADRKTATVLFGVVKMRVAIGDLQPTEREIRKQPSSADLLAERPSTVSRELDLRGMTGDEALPLVDKFIDDAVLAGLNRIDIIHGKGTGALRKKVTEFLSGHPRVRSYRLGEWNEGGTGATVVELSGE